MLTNETPQGLEARLTRIARGLRQIDVAELANVNAHDISDLELGRRYVAPSRRLRILEVLGLGTLDQSIQRHGPNQQDV